MFHRSVYLLLAISTCYTQTKSLPSAGDTSAGDNYLGDMWFGPRLGKRSLLMTSQQRSNIQHMLEAADILKYYYNRLPTYQRQRANMDLNNVVAGRTLQHNSKKDSTDTVNYTPRLGRTLVDRDVESNDGEPDTRDQDERYLMSPRLGRQSDDYFFTPRLGRQLQGVVSKVQ